jgi:hypothetical protein
LPLFSGSCQGIRQIEEVIRGTGSADCLSDGGKPFNIFGVTDHKSAEYSRLYELYLNKGKYSIFAETVMIRFEYDERSNGASLKIGRKDMDKLIKYMPTLVQSAIQQIQSSDVKQVSENGVQHSVSESLHQPAP